MSETTLKSSDTRTDYRLFLEKKISSDPLVEDKHKDHLVEVIRCGILVVDPSVSAFDGEVFNRHVEKLVSYLVEILLKDFKVCYAFFF